MSTSAQNQERRTAPKDRPDYRRIERERREAEHYLRLVAEASQQYGEPIWTLSQAAARF